MATKSTLKVQFSLSRDDARKALKFMIDQDADSVGLAAKRVFLQALDNPKLLEGAELDPVQVKRMLTDLRMTNEKLVEQNLALQTTVDKLLEKINMIIRTVVDTQNLIEEQMLPLLTETHEEVTAPMAKK